MAQTQSISSEWLYDRLLVPSGSANSVFTGFAVGNGGQDPNGAAGVAKTYADCNLPSSAGRLNKPDSFVVQGLNCFPEIGTVYADQLLIYQQCWVELKNSNNVVVAWRLSHDMIPAGTGWPVSQTSVVPLLGVPSIQNYVVMSSPILLDIEEAFSCNLNFAIAPKNLSPTFSVANIQWRVVLRGPHATIFAKDGKSSPLTAAAVT